MTLKKIKNLVFSCYWIRIIPADRQGLLFLRIDGRRGHRLDDHRLDDHQDGLQDLQDRLRSRRDSYRRQTGSDGR